MEKDYLPAITFIVHTHAASWQEQLRRSVRLYLALGAPAVNEQELLQHLQRTEEELLDYLLQGEPPTAKARQQAQAFLDMSQNALLRSEDDVQLLLRELADEQRMGTLLPDTTPLVTR